MVGQQHNSNGKLRFEKTDGSSVFLNRFARTVFMHLSVSPSKKIWDSKKIENLTPANTDIFNKKSCMISSRQFNAHSPSRVARRPSGRVAP